MIPIETLRELYAYNYWARDQQIKVCEELTGEQFSRPMGNSFPSVRDTLAHLLVVEWLWHERWRGRPVTKQDTMAFAGGNFTSVGNISARWEPVEKDVRDYLGSLKDADLTEPLTYTNLQGQQWTYPLWRVLIHVVNHQTYHRGQITTLLRQMGAPAVSTDYLIAHDVHGLG